MVAAVAIIAMTSAWLAVRRTEEQTLLRIQNVVETLSDFRLTYTDAILEKMSGLSGAEFLALDRDGGEAAERAEHRMSRQSVERLAHLGRFGEESTAQRSDDRLDVDMAVRTIA